MPTSMTPAEIETAFFGLETRKPGFPAPDEIASSLNAVSFSIALHRNEHVVLRFIDVQGRAVDLRLNAVVAGALQSSINGLCREAGWYDSDGIVPAG